MGPLLVILGTLCVTGCGLGLFMYADGHSQTNYLVPVFPGCHRARSRFPSLYFFYNANSRLIAWVFILKLLAARPKRMMKHTD